ncbi:MAG: hypothetical protein IKA94_07435 [Mogibacterium sp.]|nr:hypothetical protein [Mogibacterium sp.]
MENNDPVMEYGERFKRRVSLSELVATHEQRKRSLREEARRIKDSSEARKFLIKNIGKKDPYELLAVACRCIYDLTGDTYFEKHTSEMISLLREVIE